MVLVVSLLLCPLVAEAATVYNPFTEELDYIGNTTVTGVLVAFQTVDVPAGTDPVADLDTDTLTITETSPLVITGTAATDTIDITWSSVDVGADGTIQANAVALGTDTTNNYVATIADAGNTTITVANSGTETAAVTLDAVDLNCTGCLSATELAADSVGSSEVIESESYTVANLTASSTVTGVAADFSGPSRLAHLASCDTIDTDSSGNLRCGTDSGTGTVANVGTDCNGPDCFTGTEGTTLASSSSDLTISDNLIVAALNAHVELTPTGGDVLEWWGNAASMFGLRNKTDAIDYLLIGAAHQVTLGSASVPVMTLDATNVIMPGNVTIGITGVSGIDGLGIWDHDFVELYGRTDNHESFLIEAESSGGNYPSTMTVSNAGSTPLAFQSRGYDGASFRNAARIELAVRDAPSVGSLTGIIYFRPYLTSSGVYAMSVAGDEANVSVPFKLGATTNPAGVSLDTDDDGALILTGLGNGSDESLTLNLDDTSNVIDLSSTTGVTDFQLSSMALNVSGTHPCVKLTDTSTSERDVELCQDTHRTYLTDTTDGKIIADLSSTGQTHTASTNALRLRTAGMFCGGTLSTTMDCEDAKTRIPANCTVQRVSLQAGTGPASQAIIVDVNECDSTGASCTTIDSGTKPQIAASATSGEDTAFTDTTLAQGNFLQMDIDQVGTGTTGADLTVTLTCLM